MIVGIPKEIKDQEYRVAMTPGGVKSLTGSGHRVLVQKSAGKGSGFLDADYIASGAEIVPAADSAWKADIVVKVKEPQPGEYEFMRPNLYLFTFLHLAAGEKLTRELIRRGVIGIAYETVALDSGELPLLKPMSEVAGRIAVQVGAHYLEKENGGKGKLLGGVPGVEPARVVIIGAGVVGSNAARIALGMGAHVLVLSIGIDRLRHLEDILPGRLHTLSSNPLHIAEAVSGADLVIGAVLVPGARAPRIVTREMIESMQPGSVVIDVSVDQGGCMETTRPTSHSDPVYEINGVIHYAVTNMPGAVPETSTQALANATLPYIRLLADHGQKAFCQERALGRGVNTFKGEITHRGVAEAFALSYTPLTDLL